MGAIKVIGERSARGKIRSVGAAWTLGATGYTEVAARNPYSRTYLVNHPELGPFEVKAVVTVERHITGKHKISEQRIGKRGKVYPAQYAPTYGEAKRALSIGLVGVGGLVAWGHESTKYWPAPERFNMIEIYGGSLYIRPYHDKIEAPYASEIEGFEAEALALIEKHGAKVLAARSADEQQTYEALLKERADNRRASKVHRNEHSVSERVGTDVFIPEYVFDDGGNLAKSQSEAKTHAAALRKLGVPARASTCTRVEGGFGVALLLVSCALSDQAWEIFEAYRKERGLKSNLALYSHFWT